tara:strand:- start:353 stop:616 length:264 start_codon:yes stop_codon:yes gene_type:complete
MPYKLPRGSGFIYPNMFGNASVVVLKPVRNTIIDSVPTLGGSSSAKKAEVSRSSVKTYKTRKTATVRSEPVEANRKSVNAVFTYGIR